MFHAGPREVTADEARRGSQLSAPSCLVVPMTSACGSIAKKVTDQMATDKSSPRR